MSAMPKTILIVDDDQTLVVLLKEGLQTLGYQVCVALDSLDGISQARRTKPDVVILDYYMPGGGGPKVYEHLRRDCGTARIPVIFSTGAPIEEINRRLGANASAYFLKKPLALNQIVTLLNSLPGLGTPIEPMGPGKIPKRRQGLAAGAARYHEFDVRVTYGDTDKMGIIYYSNYFRYFEQGRTELLRSLGVRYRDLEIQRKLFLPVVSAGCRYLAPRRYDDLLTVRTRVSSLGQASI